MNKDFKIFAAPLQGFTEAPWRIAHNEVFGGTDAYYTPFVRVDKGRLRNKDMRDVAPVSCPGLHTVPQIIASEADEFRFLADYIISLGYKEIDLNMGCPFPLIVNRGKGSGLLPETDKIASILDVMGNEYAGIGFSIKMRLGMSSADEWKNVLPLLNDSCVKMVTLHPRIGKQQYKGNVDMESFTRFYNECRKPLVYNGDITGVDDIRSIRQNYPLLEGVMIGRGILANGALASCFKNGSSVDSHELYRMTLKMHELIFSHYSSTIEGGDAQLLQKMKTMWEYWLPDMDKKKRKAILKAGKLDLYLRAVENICY